MNPISNPLERGWRQISVSWSDLRMRMRDDTVELRSVEELVSLIAERYDDHARRHRTKARRARAAVRSCLRGGRRRFDAIRKIIATLETREQDEIGQVRQAFANTMEAIRRGLYFMAGVTLLLVMALFMAVRRLRSFIPDAPGAVSGSTVEIAAGASPVAKDSGWAPCCTMPC